MPSLRFALLLSAAAAGVVVESLCSLRKDAVIAVYADVASGGVGPDSDTWTRAFFSWWSAANANDLVVDYITRSADLGNYYTDGCQLSSGFPALRLYVQPGGDASNASSALGPGGRDNILDFAASSRTRAYMGTCAGFYYAAGTWWWNGVFAPMAWTPHWFPTVEGPINAIARYPAYAPTKLSDGSTMLYFGGPAYGLSNATGSVLPAGVTVLATFDAPGVPAGVPAVLTYEGPYARLLLNSVHPEAMAGVNIACEAPAPPGCITAQQQLSNWRALANNINAFLGTNYVVPTSLL